MGKVKTTACYLCDDPLESISHLYWECKVSRRLWERLKIYLEKKDGIKVKLQPLEFLFGIDTNNHQSGPSAMINLLGLIVKKCIHSNKCKDTLPTELGLLANINMVKNIERNIAWKKGGKSWMDFRRKWHWDD